jgi:hypothetical protein
MKRSISETSSTRCSGVPVKISDSRGEILSGETIQSIVSVRVTEWDGEGLKERSCSSRQEEQEAENNVTSPVKGRW